MTVIRPRVTLRRVLLAVVALLVAVGGAIPAALAHDYLVSSNPRANSTVTAAPKDVTLTFNDIVLSKPARPQITVKGPGGRYYETGCGTATDTAVTTPVGLGPAGKYTVTWRIVSADGHPVSDALSFTYTGKPGANAGLTSPKACTEAASAPATPQTSSSGVPTGAVVAVVIIAVLGVGGAAYILLTRGRGVRPDDGEDEGDEE